MVGGLKPWIPLAVITPGCQRTLLTPLVTSLFPVPGPVQKSRHHLGLGIQHFEQRRAGAWGSFPQVGGWTGLGLPEERKWGVVETSTPHFTEFDNTAAESMQRNRGFNSVEGAGRGSQCPQVRALCHTPRFPRRKITFTRRPCKP